MTIWAKLGLIAAIAVYGAAALLKIISLYELNMGPVLAGPDSINSSN